ncbi:MAG: tRNA N6-adenosine threonylcarbamoyltransferase [Pseudomonadota bacterium]|jgi:tRNA threonylcarbamoyladenosine biosynthesis protein TsaB
MVSIMSNVPVLFVDASILGVQVAIIDAASSDKMGTERILWHGAHNENMGALQAISKLTHQGLAALNIRFDQLAGLAVGSGPGSFTGIKVGLAFAYGLSTASGKPMPMLAVSALEATALAIAESSDVAVFLPATKTHGFATVAPAPDSSVLYSAAALVDCDERIPELLAELPPSCQLISIGEWSLLDEVAAKRHRKIAVMAPAQACRIAMATMADQIAAAWPDNFKPDMPEPKYLRLSTAEEKLLAPNNSSSAKE